MPAAAQIEVRLRPPDREWADAVLRPHGIGIPAGVNSVAFLGAAATLRLGPDEWLVVDDERAGPALADLVESRLASRPHAVIDVSAARVGLDLSGPRTADVLASMCPVDLHERALPVGRCVQTLAARAPVIIYPIDAGRTFRLLVRPSMREYLAEWLRDAIEVPETAEDR